MEKREQLMSKNRPAYSVDFVLMKGVGRAYQAKVPQHHVLGLRKRMALDGRRLCRPPGRVEPKRSTDSINIRQEYLAIP